MTMRVHHLNCGSMRPLGAPDGLVCHVLLIETDRGLVLVDSGYGLADIEAAARRVGPSRFYVRPRFDPDETAIRQVERLGFHPRDVRDIVITHFDADHVGGLADFPWARVHLSSAEAFAALHPRSFVEKQRYRPAQRDHGPMLVEHGPARAESWLGFASAKPLREIADGLVLVNLPGHSRGHAAVAVETDAGWLLHVGDAFYHRAQIDGSDERVPRSLAWMERMVAHDWQKVRQNHARIRALLAVPEVGLRLVNAHDPLLFERARANRAQASQEPAGKHPAAEP